MPNVGLELTTLRLRVAHSTNRASQAPLLCLTFNLSQARIQGAVTEGAAESFTSVVGPSWAIPCSQSGPVVQNP